MLFYDRKLVAMAYHDWLIHESNNVKPKDYQIEDCPESFLAFLQSMGWLKENEILKYTRKAGGTNAIYNHIQAAQEECKAQNVFKV